MVRKTQENAGTSSIFGERARNASKPKPGDLPPINHMQHVESLTKLYSAPDSFPEVNFCDLADNVPVSSENLPEIKSMSQTRSNDADST